MSYGFAVINSNGYMQLNETTRTFRVVEQGFVNAYAAGFGYEFKLNHDVLSGAKTLFLRKISGSPTGSIAVVDGVSTIGDSALGSYEYVVVDITGWSQPSGYGLAIYDAGGAVAFNSENTLMDITSVVYMPVNFSTPDSSSTVSVSTAPYSSANIFFPLVQTGVFLKSGSNVKLFYCGVNMLSNSSVEIGVGSFSAPNNPAAFPSSHIFVIPFGVVR